MQSRQHQHPNQTPRQNQNQAPFKSTLPTSTSFLQRAYTDTRHHHQSAQQSAQQSASATTTASSANTRSYSGFAVNPIFQHTNNRSDFSVLPPPSHTATTSSKRVFLGKSKFLGDRVFVNNQTTSQPRSDNLSLAATSTDFVSANTRQTTRNARLSVLQPPSPQSLFTDEIFGSMFSAKDTMPFFTDFESKMAEILRCSPASEKMTLYRLLPPSTGCDSSVMSKMMQCSPLSAPSQSDVDELDTDDHCNETSDDKRPIKRYKKSKCHSLLTTETYRRWAVSPVNRVAKNLELTTTTPSMYFSNERDIPPFWSGLVLHSDNGGYTQTILRTTVDSKDATGLHKPLYSDDLIIVFLSSPNDAVAVCAAPFEKLTWAPPVRTNISPVSTSTGSLEMLVPIEPNERESKFSKFGDDTFIYEGFLALFACIKQKCSPLILTKLFTIVIAGEFPSGFYASPWQLKTIEIAFNDSELESLLPTTARIFLQPDACNIHLGISACRVFPVPGISNSFDPFADVLIDSTNSSENATATTITTSTTFPQERVSLSDNNPAVYGLALNIAVVTATDVTLRVPLRIVASQRAAFIPLDIQQQNNAIGIGYNIYQAPLDCPRPFSLPIPSASSKSSHIRNVVHVNRNRNFMYQSEQKLSDTFNDAFTTTATATVNDTTTANSISDAATISTVAVDASEETFQQQLLQSGKYSSASLSSQTRSAIETAVRNSGAMSTFAMCHSEPHLPNVAYHIISQSNDHY